MNPFDSGKSISLNHELRNDLRKLKYEILLFLACGCGILLLVKFVSMAAVGFAIIGCLGLAAAFLLCRIIFGSDHLALVLLITTAFTQCLFHLAGLPRAVPTLFTELCVLLLLIKVLYREIWVLRRRPNFFGAGPIFCLAGIFVVSLFYNREELIPAIMNARLCFIFILFYLAIQNLTLADNTVIWINRYIVFLFLAQLPTSWLKFLIYGQDEFWIGTVSVLNGSLSTTLPLFAIAFLTAFYLFTHEIKYILLIIGFYLFGIIGEKRALAFFIPLVFVLETGLYWIMNRPESPFAFSKLVKAGAIFLFMSVVFLGGTVNLITNMNPDFRYGGNLDFRYLIIDRVIEYNTRDLELEMDPEHTANPNILKGPDGKIRVFKPESSMGRVTVTRKALRRLSEAGMVHSLIGFGPGTMIRSPHIGRSKETPYQKFGIYGKYTGLVVYVLQVGILGVVALVYFFFKQFLLSFRLYRRQTKEHHKAVALGFMGATFVFGLDFFTYSLSTFHHQTLILVYFWAAMLIYRELPCSLALAKTD